ncbi:MAG: hypothetical protein HUU57_01155 [Bdellovibrio sp.]|nr:hypothetical protein [Bdellovibrio sp.]
MNGFSKLIIPIAAGACVWFFYSFKEDAKVLADSEVAAFESGAQKEMPEASIVESKTDIGVLEESSLPTESAMSLSEFSELTKTAQKKLPTLQDFKKLKPKEAHTTPLLIQQAGVELGKIAQALHDNPNFASEAVIFYRDCFSRINLPDQIRGLCLANHRNLRLKNGDRAEWNREEVEQTTPEIQDLAQKIPL